MKNKLEQKTAKVTRKNAILAKCHNCMGEYYDGKNDCRNYGCSLYSFMPYAKGKPDLHWTKINPKFKGNQSYDETSKPGGGNPFFKSKKKKKSAENEEGIF